MEHEMTRPVRLAAPSAFGLFYASFAVSILGDAFRLLAVNVWIFNATVGSITDRLLLVLLANVPGMILGGVSGVIADRYDKYAVLVGSDLLRIAVGLGLAWCSLDARTSFALVLVAAGNAVGVFFTSSSFSLVPRLVEEAKLPHANGLMETGQWVVQIVGPSLAAITLATAGASVAFVVDSASFAASALILWYLRRLLTAPVPVEREAAPAAAGDDAAEHDEHTGGPLRDFIDGARIIWQGKEIRALIFASYGVVFLTACTNYGLIFLVARTFNAGTESLGYIYSLNGAVAVVAATTVTALVKPSVLGRVLAGSIVGLCVAQVVMGVAPNLWVLGIGVAISAMANAPYNVSVASLYMKKVPSEYLGRVEGIDTMVDNLVNILGFAAAALVIREWSPRAVFLMSALVAVPSLVVACTRVARGDRTAPVPEKEAVGA
jgi:predicted MFS family arabinose efflux permease